MFDNTDNFVSISEVDEDFSRVAKLVNENGAVVILENNTPRYVLMEYSQFQNEDYADDATVQEIGERIVIKHLQAFKELAK